MEAVSREVVLLPEYKKQPAASNAPLVQQFVSPGLDSRPMARMWFPDAAAGVDENDCVDRELRSLAEGGMGGVEIAFLADGCGIEDAEQSGWGTPAWVSTLKKVMRTARSIPGGFKVDFTISPHWPPNIFTIDPNDAAASSDLHYAWRKITAADLQRGTVDVPLPEMKLYDQKGNPFIFKYSYVGTSVARVSDMPRPKMRGFKPPPEAAPLDGYAVLGALPEGVTAPDLAPERDAASGFVPPAGQEFVPEGMRREDIDWSVPFEPLPWRSRAEITLQFDSMLDVSGRTAEKPEGGWACGVPDQAALDRWYGGKVTLSDVEAAFGPPADEASLRPDGKRDSRFLRRRMADFQKEYQLNLEGLQLEAASEGEELQPGDWIVIGFFYRGTGQQLSGGGPWKIMPNQTYVASYLIPEGADAVTDYWDRYILSDPELRQLVEENAREVGGSIFEDSIELHTSGAPWGKGFETYIPACLGYPVGNYLPVLAGFATDNRLETERITQDFAAAVGRLYTENHVQRVSRWAKSFGYNFRAQAYSLGGLGITEAALATDVTEGDNSTYDDALRQLQTAVNIKPDEKFLSMESNTFNKFGFSWQSLLREVHYNASQGVNRVIFHGCAYPKTGTGYMDWWPGWNWGEKARASAFMAWDRRNLWWDEAHRLTDYISRLQTVLQEGCTRVDLAVLPSLQLRYELGEGSSHPYLLDRGWSYNLLDESVFTLPELTVRDGRLCPDGPAYRALVLHETGCLKESTVREILRLAQAGLPVVLEGSLPARVFGVSRTGNSDAGLQALLEQLQELENVYTAADDAALAEVLASAGILPAARYQCPGVECSHLTDGTGDYYYFYNGGEKPVEFTARLEGSGTPVRLDCWTGRLEKIPDASENAVPLRLVPGGALISALLPDTAPALPAESLHCTGEQLLSGLSLELTSYGPPKPGDPEYDPSWPVVSHTETVQYDAVPNFSDWAHLPADGAILQRLRVSSMADVSGVGIYRGTFDIPAGTAAADLLLAHHAKDIPVTVVINGTDAGTPDAMTEILPLDSLIHEGKNTIEIRVASTLDNRLYYEDPIALQSFPPEKDVMAKLRPAFIKDDWTIRYPVGLYSAAVRTYAAAGNPAASV